MLPQDPSEEEIRDSDPFVILHNYRTNRRKGEHPEKAKRHPHDYSLDRKSIIMTRKMKAELDQQNTPIKNPSISEDVERVEESDLKSE